MPLEPISLNDDIKKLVEKGYSIELRDGYLLAKKIPYVNKEAIIKYGTLVSQYSDSKPEPTTHVIYFVGEHPCNKDGSIMNGLVNGNLGCKKLVEGIEVNFSFSSKPKGNYKTYFDKIETYVNIISSPAFSINNLVTPLNKEDIEVQDNYIFNYIDSNSTRAEIGAISNKLKGQRITIIGLGGTGSYLLDFISKTPVAEINIYDGDIFLSHNAFRSPGAPSREMLIETQKKVNYFYNIYSRMHKNIIPHSEYIDNTNISEILESDFVFMCLDKGKIKKLIIDLLIENKISFIDVGMGINNIENSLIGQLRVTSCTLNKKDHLSKHISFADNTGDEYSTNIQIAELNALNATLAIIKWKKIMGFYQDLVHESNTVYSINNGELFNGDFEI